MTRASKTPAAKTTPAASKKTASKKKTPAPSEVVAAPVENVVVETASETPEVAVLESVTKLQEFGAKIQQLTGILAALKQDFKTLDKVVNREMKALQKNTKKRKANSNRQPSGFVKPTRISSDLAKFLGRDEGVEMARTDVTKEITAYIRKNNLQDKDNGRKIIPDAKLKNLLGDLGDDVLTYFNLQKYMSPHFAKSVKADA